MKRLKLPIEESRLAAILREHGVIEASVFGSFARGDAQPESDLDLLVSYGPGTTLFDAIGLQEDLEKESGRKVDLVSKKYLSSRLAKRIETDIRSLSGIA
jgi:uncharacterized protein